MKPFEQISKVFRIPLKRVYALTHNKDAEPWALIYGDVHCRHCGKLIGEGIPYRRVVTIKKYKDGSARPIHKFQHVTCEES